MSIERMADRALSLTERVEAWYWSERTDRGAIGYQEAVTALLADIAAADRLARADWAVFEAALRGEPHSPAKRLEYETALDDYRARMAQGVGNEHG